jgi:hypothetical protein
MAKKIMLNNVRLSFPILGEPERYQNKPDQKPRWSATALIPNTDTAQQKMIMAEIKAVAEEQWKAKAGAALAAILSDRKACCYVDGKTKDYDGYQEAWALTAHRYADKGRPLVISAAREPIYKADGSFYDGMAGKIYSGCYVNFQFELWAQDNSNGKAIRATLLGVQFLRDGDAFGGGVAPKVDDFGDVSEGADADSLAD